MAYLTRWDPFREMAALRNTVDRLFDESMQSADWEGRSIGALALDVAENEDGYIVKASLPGVNPDDIEVTLTDNTLTVRGEIKADTDIDEKNYRLRERRSGTFMRSVTLPVPVDSEKVEAVNEHGVLTLRLPKAEAVKPKKIAVRKMIESNGQ